MATREETVFICDNCGAEDHEGMPTYTLSDARNELFTRDFCLDCEGDLLAIFDRHTGSKTSDPTRCLICHRTFISDRGLNQHVAKMHRS